MATAEEADGDKAVCVRSMHLMASGSAEEFAEVYAPAAVNREAVDEPAAARAGGPGGFYATARWLREAYSGLRFEVHDAVREGELVAVHATMSGRQSGPFTAYADDASVEMVFPSRGREFAVTQTHWFRVQEGKIVEHWADRDDLTMGRQLGWTPPTPIYLATMLRRPEPRCGTEDGQPRDGATTTSPGPRGSGVGRSWPAIVRATRRSSLRAAAR